MWKSGLVLVEKVVVWSEGLVRPSRRIVLQEMVRVTKTDLVGLLMSSVSESDDDDDEEDDELARRAFLVVGFLEGVAWSFLAQLVIVGEEVGVAEAD